MTCLFSGIIHRVFPVRTGATPTAQIQWGLLPRLWIAAAKYLVQCAEQRCTDANNIKGTMHTLQCEKKNTSHNSETANDIDTNARQPQDRGRSLKTFLLLINMSIFLNVSLWFRSKPIGEKLQKLTFICGFKVLKKFKCPNPAKKITLRRIRSVCKV